MNITTAIMKNKKKKSSPSTTQPLPLQVVGTIEGEDGSSNSKELQIVDPASYIFSNSSSPEFKLPRGWSVEERPRSKSKIRDRYYYEPGTRRQFRSLIAVQRYLNGETEYGRRNSRSSKCSDEINMQIVPSTRHNKRSLNSSNENNMQIVPSNRKNASSFGLPNNWVVEEIPRTNRNYAGVIDRFFIEPETGLRFRSRIAAERHIEQFGEIPPKIKANQGNRLMENNVSDYRLPLRMITKSPSSADSAEQFKDAEKELKQDDRIIPSKIKWVLGGPGGTIWNAFEGEEMVSESVKREWSETFLISIHDQS